MTKPIVFHGFPVQVHFQTGNTDSILVDVQATLFLELRLTERAKPRTKPFLLAATWYWEKWLRGQRPGWAWQLRPTLYQTEDGSLDQDGWTGGHLGSRGNCYFRRTQHLITCFPHSWQAGFTAHALGRWASSHLVGCPGMSIWYH